MDYNSMRTHGCRIFEYFHNGHEFINLENEKLRLEICTSRGADILTMLYKPMDIDLMFHTPTGLKNPHYIQTCASSGGNYSDYLAGGWQELLPAGGPDIFMGAELGLHGELSLVPWYVRIIKDEPEEITIELTGQTVRMPFKTIKTITLKSTQSIIYFEEKLSNLCAQDLPYMWAQHPTFGAPFINKETRIDVPAGTFLTSDFYYFDTSTFAPSTSGKWPEEAGGLDIVSTKPRTDLFYLKDLTEGWYAITNPDFKIGFGLVWDKEIFPYITSWQALNSSPNAPYFNNIYALSLELWSAFTDRLKTAIPSGTVPVLRGYDSVSTQYKAVIYTGLEKVERITREGKVL